MKNVAILKLYGNKIGGTEVATTTLKQLLLDSNISVTIEYAVNFGGDNNELTQPLVRAMKPKIIFIIKYCFSLFNLVKKYDVVISTDIFSTLLLSIISVFYKKFELIAWEHYPYDKNSKIWRLIFEHLKLHSKVSKFVVLSESEKLKVKSFSNVNVIPNYINYPNEYKKHLDSDVLELIYVGRIVEEKGLERLINILLITDSVKWKFKIIGDGPLLNKLQIRFKNDKRISFLGEKKNIKEYLLKSDVFVSGSYFECFPITVLESMSYGIPVLSMEVSGGTRSVLSDSGGGFVTDDESLFLTYLNELNIAVNRNEIGFNGRAFIKSKYGSDIILNKWKGILGI